MGVTKRAKLAVRKTKQVITEYSYYLCPSCHTEFSGCGPAENVIRFRCRCGQELIVDKEK